MTSWLRAWFVGSILFGVACASFADEKPLTTDGRIKSSPVFTDNTGTELAFVVQESAVQMQLCQLKLADGSVTPLHPKQPTNEFEPAYSPDGQWFAFIQSRGNLTLAIVIQNLTRGSETEVAPGGGFSGARSPAISPDGSTLLYSYPESDVQSIWGMDLPAGKRRPVIAGPGINNWPNFAPDGKRFVFSSTRDGNFEIYTANADGSDIQRLTHEARQDIRPRFSPDGKRIAFISGRDGNYEIYTMQADGTNLVRVTTNAERDDYPTWHPDGQHLVIVAERRGKHDLVLINVP